MRFRFFTLPLAAVLMLSLFGAVLAQGSRPQSELSSAQRLDVMRSRLEALRRSLSTAIAGIPAADKTKKTPNADDPRVRLQGIDKEVASILSEVNDIHAKQDRSEHYETSKLDTLETAVTDISTKVEAALQATASARTGAGTTTASNGQHTKKRGRLLGLIPRGGSNDKYEELTSVARPGRDRELFSEGAKEVRKGDHDTGRLLFTTIITTYPDSAFLPLAKLAIADSFYLEGSTSALIQAAASYQDWLTFFPTDPLADAAMLKVAEAEMRQMGLPDRSIEHARKAEQRLKALLQQYPQTKLRPTVDGHLHDVQEVLAMHGFGIGMFYLGPRYQQGKGGLKGAQSRFKEVVDKYPTFSRRDEALFNLAYTYQQEEEPDEAAKYYQEILRNFPNSERADQARDQLTIIGAAIPEADPARAIIPRPDKPSFINALMTEVKGSTDVAVDKDGILIRRDSKEGEDLIDLVLQNNGQLPSNVQPMAPRVRGSQRTPEAPVDTTPPEKKKTGITIQGTPNGPVPNRNTPGVPPPAPTPLPSGDRP
jgi:outer membrane protein assembly factor BamD